MRRVAFVCNFPDGGPGGGPSGVLSVLKSQIDREGGELECKFVFRPKVLSSVHAKIKQRIRVRLFRAPLVLLLHAFGNVFLTLRLFRFRSPETTVIAHDVYSAIRCQLVRVDYVLIYHGQGSLLNEFRSMGRSPGFLSRQWLCWLEESAFEAASYVGFPSDGARQAFLSTSEVSGPLLKKIGRESFIMWNGVSYRTWRAGRDLSGACGNLNDLSESPAFDLAQRVQNSNKKVFLTVSSLTHLKGVDRIPRLLSEIKGFRESGLWVVVGDGPLRTEVEAEVVRFALETNFLPVVGRLSHQQVQALMEISQYYVMAHRTSIFDMATLEAMEWGLVPILSPVGGNLEVNTSKNVIYTEKLGAFRFEELEEYRARNLRAHSENFSSKAMADRYRKFVQDL